MEGVMNTYVCREIPVEESRDPLPQDLQEAYPP